MSRLLLCLLLSSLGCAAIVRHGSRDLVVYGPEELEAFDRDQRVWLQPDGNDGKHARYTASLPSDAQELTLRTPGQEAKAQLQTYAGWGWVATDLLFFGFIGAAIDWGTGSWNYFSDLDASALPWAPRPEFAERKLAPRSGRPALDRGKLVVLLPHSFASDLQDTSALAGLLRTAAVTLLTGVEVLPDETGASYVVSGELIKVGTGYRLALKLRDAREDRLLATAVATGRSVPELEESVKAAATWLFLR